jgi:hypothetical protein
MTDREKELLKKEPVDAIINEDFVREDAWTLPGEEIDPDSVRPVPLVDEDGEPVDREIDEEIRRGEY